MTGGSFPRSFPSPGTETSICVGGFTDMTTDYWFSGGPPNGNATTTVGSTCQLQVVPLYIHGQTVPGFPTCIGARPGMGLLNAERFRHPYGAPTIHVSSEWS
jgi:hypothetical protein